MTDRLNVDGAAAHLGVPPRYVRQLVATRRIPFIKYGTSRNGPIRFDVADLDAWLAAQRVETSA